MSGQICPRFSWKSLVLLPILSVMGGIASFLGNEFCIGSLKGEYFVGKTVNSDMIRGRKGKKKGMEFLLPTKQ